MAASMIKGDSRYHIINEVVQRAYIKLHKYDKLHKCINKDGTLSKSYMFLTIRSVAYDRFKDNSKMQEYNGCLDDRVLDNSDLEKNEATALIVDKMNYYLRTEFDWFDRQAFKLYYDSGMSMQKLSDETSIAKTSIFLSVKKVKVRLKELLREDYLDLKNKEYKLIKPLSK
jgi:DNA-directed RNA polymerase specialized sigma24 family protein